MTTNHSHAHDAASVKILRRADYKPVAHHEPVTYANEHAPSGATTRSGVFVPAHMLRPGATVEEAADVARNLGVVTHEAYVPRHTTQPTDELMDHEYDGIREYDNPTPGWWHMIFAGSVVFSVLYVMIYHSVVPTLHERYAAAEAHALEVRFAELRTIPDGETKLLHIMSNEGLLAQGEAIFQSSCTLCHGQQAEGLVGPNLTDDYYKNATTLAGMYDVVLNGAANGAMPPKGGAPLNTEEVSLVTAYVASLRGQNLEGPRGPEGEQAPPFPPPVEYNPNGG